MKINSEFAERANLWGKLQLIIEDGHDEVRAGFQTTDAGAPEWGNFDFTIAVQKNENSKLTLVLFESSAKDGSRQHELPIVLLIWVSEIH
jgi:hypothetical protein